MKKIYIVEKHHHILEAWAKIKKDFESLYLLTFDYHTDTHGAFLNYLYYNKENLDEILHEIDYSNNNSIHNAISKLKNDEHIDAAIKIGIINKAFVISHDGFYDNPSSNEFTNFHAANDKYIQVMHDLEAMPENLTYPESEIYVIGTSDYIDVKNCFSNDFIKKMLDRVTIMSKLDILQTNFILDIDLDYFHQYDALDIPNSVLIKELVSAACAITIATEPDFALNGIDVEILLEKLIEVIKTGSHDEFKKIDLR